MLTDHPLTCHPVLTPGRAARGLRKRALAPLRVDLVTSVGSTLIETEMSRDLFVWRIRLTGILAKSQFFSVFFFLIWSKLRASKLGNFIFKIIRNSVGNSRLPLRSIFGTKKSREIYTKEDFLQVY